MQTVIVYTVVHAYPAVPQTIFPASCLL